MQRAPNMNGGGIIRRVCETGSTNFSEQVPDFIKPVLIARGIYSDEDLRSDLKDLPSPDSLKDVDKAAELLADVIIAKKPILIVGDYDIDGASSVVLALRVLKRMAAQQVKYLMPQRARDGYGLTPELARQLMNDNPPCLVLTVDNGIRSYEGVQLLKKNKFQVIITDHHLPAQRLPQADAVVNPNRSDCNFPAKNLAGVGVCFYLLCCLRSVLRARNYFLYNGITPPNMAQFLDLVALGTLADMVAMDKTNRIFVDFGLNLMRQGKTSVGIKKLLKYRHKNLDVSRLVFEVIPILNAAGRMGDMSVSVDFLKTDLPAVVESHHTQLQSFNYQRRKKLTTMRKEAAEMVAPSEKEDALCLFDASWHIGLTGPLANALVDEFSRPAVIFGGEDMPDDLLRGSARSPSFFRLDTLFEGIIAEAPQLLVRYGGHKHAAGLTIRKKDLDKFRSIYKRVAVKCGALTTEPHILTDGSLPVECLTASTARTLAEFMPWGKEFPPPLFDDEFALLGQEYSPTGTLKLKLKRAGCQDSLCALKFRHSSASYPIKAKRLRLAYSLLAAPHLYGGDLVLRTQYLEELE